MNKEISNWFIGKQKEVMIFNLCVLALSVLHTAGYFHPYFVISINIVVLASFVLAILVLGVGSRTMFVISLAFLFITLFFKLVQVHVWAERMSIYVFESLTLATIVLFVETIGKKKESLL